jgi:hypothetical protein
VGEFGCGVILDIGFQPIPIAFIIADFFAIGANRQ